MKNIIFFGAFLISLTLPAQTFNTAKLDSLLTRVEESNKGMGSLSVYQNGEEVYARSIGYANVEDQAKSHSLTRYRVGSISKMFTATIILQLMEEGKLKLDTKLSTFFPAIPNAEHIKISHLLRHQSGVFNIGKDKTFQEWKYSVQTREQLLNKFHNYPAEFTPGEKSAYSNTNYILLSMIIEELENADFSKVFKKRILDPINLQNTYYGNRIDPSKSEAYSYERLSKWEKAKETDASVTRGAGAIVSTPSDLNKFIFALFEGELISPSSLDKMQEIDKNFGLGLYPISFYKQENLIGHTGSLDGFASMLAHSPDKKMAIAYSSNGYNMPMDDLMSGIFSIAFNKENILPEMKNAKLTADELQLFTGTYGGENFPLDINIFVENEILMAQGTGQPKFPLDPINTNTFKFDRAGLKMEFVPLENKMIFMQGENKLDLFRK